MSTPEQPPSASGLNPALRHRTDETYDTSVSSLAPADTASVQNERGRTWPIIWAVVTLACVAIAIWILVL